MNDNMLILPYIVRICELKLVIIIAYVICLHNLLMNILII